MCLHQLAQYFVFLSDFFFQRGDFIFLASTFAILNALEGGCSLFKELVLPAIKDCWLQLVFVADLRHGGAIYQMFFE